MFDKVLDIKKCWLQDDISNRIRLAVKKFAIDNNYPFFDLREQTGLMRNIIVRTASTGEIMLIVVFFEDDTERIQAMMNFIAREFPQITSLLYIVNTKANDTITDQEVHVFRGRDYIFEEMDGLRFKIGPKSFYQTNSAQAYELYKVAADFAALTGDELVYDLYTGTGTIANFVARRVRKVIGIEYVPEAIEDAKANAAFNGLDNTLFLCRRHERFADSRFHRRARSPRCNYYRSSSCRHARRCHQDIAFCCSPTYRVCELQSGYPSAGFVSARCRLSGGSRAAGRYVPAYASCRECRVVGEEMKVKKRGFGRPLFFCV